MLERGALVRVTTPFLSADASLAIELLSLLDGKITHIDKDGDLRIIFPGLAALGMSHSHCSRWDFVSDSRKHLLMAAG